MKKKVIVATIILLVYCNLWLFGSMYARYVLNIDIGDYCLAGIILGVSGYLGILIYSC